MPETADGGAFELALDEDNDGTGKFAAAPAAPAAEAGGTSPMGEGVGVRSGGAAVPP